MNMKGWSADVQDVGRVWQNGWQDGTTAAGRQTVWERRLCVPDREYCPRVITYELATAWSPYCPTGFCEQNVSYFSSFFSILSE
jgi:hypothetical protein